MGKKQFSLVVTCRNEMRSLSRWKRDICTQTRFPDEIIIVDSESDDGTLEFLNKWKEETPCIRIIVEKCKPARGHNIGNKAARYDIILSTDMGVRLSSNWCEELIKPFEDNPTIDVVAGNTCIDKETLKSAPARAEYYIENGGESKLGPGFVPGNRSVAYKKSIWKSLNGLPEDLTFYADDSVFGRQMIQAEVKFGYAPNAMTYWSRPEKLKQFWKEQYVYGIGHGEADIKTPVAFRWFMKGKIPLSLVPFLTAIRNIQKQITARAIIQSLKNFDFSALILMPVLLYGNGYNLAKGHIIGYFRGETMCQECRARLK